MEFLVAIVCFYSFGMGFCRAFRGKGGKQPKGRFKPLKNIDMATLLNALTTIYARLTRACTGLFRRVGVHLRRLGAIGRTVA